MIPMAVWAPLTAAVLGGVALVFAQEPRQTFKSSVNLAVVDVHVVDARGEPVRDLSPDDFEVQLGGGRRRVVSADLVDYATCPRGARQADAGTDDPETASVRPKRRFVIAVDEHSIQPASARAAITFVRLSTRCVPPGSMRPRHSYGSCSPLPVRTRLQAEGHAPSRPRAASSK